MKARYLLFASSVLLSCSAEPRPVQLERRLQQELVWQGFVDQSDALGTASFTFLGWVEAAGDSNGNYYDGDFVDFDGDGRLDRSLISRYGLLWNSGGGVMVPAADVPYDVTGYQFGDKDGIGNDGVQWADVDGDGDPDSLRGGNGEAFTLQWNRRGRFEMAAHRIGDGYPENRSRARRGRGHRRGLGVLLHAGLRATDGVQALGERRQGQFYR